MIDRATGTVSFAEPAVSIAPSLTRDEFLATAVLAAQATTSVANEPYHSWNLGRTYHSAGLDLGVVVGFRGQQLITVSLIDTDPRFGESWADSSEEKELARLASHKAWLRACLGWRRRFRWGSVWCGYDERGGFSSIVIHYPE